MVKNLLHTNEDGAKLPRTEERQVFFVFKEKNTPVLRKSDNVMMKFPDPLFFNNIKLDTNDS